VIDLKMKPFEPEFAGKMNFYLSAVEDQSRHADDKPCIGLLPRKNSFIRGWLLHHPGREIRSREIGNRQRALRQDGYAGVGTELREVFAHVEESRAYKVVVLTGYDTYFASGGTKETLLATFFEQGVIRRGEEERLCLSRRRNPQFKATNNRPVPTHGKQARPQATNEI